MCNVLRTEPNNSNLNKCNVQNLAFQVVHTLLLNIIPIDYMLRFSKKMS